jgi:hypothetical protein
MNKDTFSSYSLPVFGNRLHLSPTPPKTENPLAKPTLMPISVVIGLAILISIPLADVNIR